jgi:cytochrome c peroxidase/DNA-binding beta-propeller fold protein YncE
MVVACCGCDARSSLGIDARCPDERIESQRSSPSSGGLAPVDITVVPDTGNLLILGSEGRRLLVLDPDAGRIVRTLRLPTPASGLAVHRTTAYVTTREPAGRVLALDLNTGVVARERRVGHSPMSPVLSGAGRTLCVANRFDHTVTLMDLDTNAARTVPVVREPVALCLSADETLLFVANHLPEVRPFLDDENPTIAAEVSVIDVEHGRLRRNIELPNGSQGLRGIAISPDGRHVAVTHVLSNWLVPPTRIAEGAMNMNALSLIDAETLDWIETVILDDPQRGAANPWDVTFANDGRHLLVTHAGTHELSIIDYRTLMARIASNPGSTGMYGPEALAMMRGIRQRVALRINGPRALVERNGVAHVAAYFSDELASVAIAASAPPSRVLALQRTDGLDVVRLGERYFNDATLCYQQWQSCATCHPDGRSDTLYWDLLNDGLANTKNTKSLLMSALTPPVMWRGVRADAATAVRAGIHHIQFTDPLPEQAEAIDAWLLAMESVPGPALDPDRFESVKTDQTSCAKCHYPAVPRGVLTPAARRGKALFEGKAGCAVCHPHPTFTSGEKVDPGLGSGVKYDVPSLIEVWRTAPYLHSGDALTLRETITDFNWMQKRGRTNDLTAQELDALIAYLQSL